VHGVSCTGILKDTDDFPLNSSLSRHKEQKKLYKALVKATIIPSTLLSILDDTKNIKQISNISIFTDKIPTSFFNIFKDFYLYKMHKTQYIYIFKSIEVAGTRSSYGGIEEPLRSGVQ
jgi:hypothetical protein